MATPVFIENAQYLGITYALMGFMMCFWFWIWNGRVDVSPLAVGWREVVDCGEWYRVVTAAFTHEAFFHMAMNMASLWTAGVVEFYVGKWAYVKILLILIWGEGALMMLMVWVGSRFFHKEQWKDSRAVGFSGVIFGLLAVSAMEDPGRMVSVFGFFTVPYFLYPFVSMGLIQLIVPNASFLGHLSGILVGFIVGFGTFDWISDYLTMCSLVFSVVAFLYNVATKAQNFTFPRWFIRFEGDVVEDAPRQRARMVNGVLVRENPRDEERRALV